MIVALRQLPEEEQAKISRALFDQVRDAPQREWGPTLKAIPQLCQEHGIPLRKEAVDKVFAELFRYQYPEKAFYALDLMERCKLKDVGMWVWTLVCFNLPEPLLVACWAAQNKVPYSPETEVSMVDIYIAFDKPYARAIGLLPKDPIDDPPRRPYFPFKPEEEKYDYDREAVAKARQARDEARAQAAAEAAAQGETSPAP